MTQRRRQFGRVRKLPSQKWQARYRDPISGRDVPAPQTFDRKADADSWLSSIQTDLLRGDRVDLHEARVTSNEWADRWLAAIAVKPSTFQHYESSLRVHVRPVFGGRAVGQIGYRDCEAFVRGMEQTGHGPGTVASARKVLRLVLAEAERADAIRRNPASGLRVRRSARDEMAFLTSAEVERLASSIERSGRHYQYALLVRVAAWTGIRAGEVSALRVGRVNPLRGTIEIAESADDRTGTIVLGPPKTYARRGVPLPATLAQELGEFIVANRPQDPEAFVFTAPAGGPLSHRNFYRRHFKPAVKAAGFERRIRFHDLRHTAAALMIAEGAHALAVKTRLGHSSITVTLDRYGHLFPAVEEELTMKLDKRYRAARFA